MMKSQITARTCPELPPADVHETRIRFLLIPFCLVLNGLCRADEQHNAWSEIGAKADPPVTMYGWRSISGPYRISDCQ